MNIFTKIKEYFQGSKKPKAITEKKVVPGKRVTKRQKHNSKMRILRFNKALKNQNKCYASTKGFSM